MHLHTCISTAIKEVSFFIRLDTFEVFCKRNIINLIEHNLSRLVWADISYEIVFIFFLFHLEYHRMDSGQNPHVNHNQGSEHFLWAMWWQIDSWTIIVRSVIFSNINNLNIHKFDIHKFNNLNIWISRRTHLRREDYTTICDRCNIDLMPIPLSPEYDPMKRATYRPQYIPEKKIIYAV